MNMASLSRVAKQNACSYLRQVRSLTSQDVQGAVKDFDDEEFRVLNLRGAQKTARKKRAMRSEQLVPPRTLKMPTDQDWTAVWPGPRSFHPASIPFPLRQGYTVKGMASPSKYANAELMKIPNFLHLTPQAIKQQCEAIKKFCTPWPKGLETDQQLEKHFPFNVISTDYCHGLPTIRHAEARRVTLTLKLSELKFDAHAKDKFLRLVGQRYNRDTDVLTIVADRCPLRKQNYDYAIYLLTACYHESFITEPWEASKLEADMEIYRFEKNKSKESMSAILNWGKTDENAKVQPSLEYAKTVEQLINDGENEYNLNKYKEEVKKMLGIDTK